MTKDEAKKLVWSTFPKRYYSIISKKELKSKIDSLQRYDCELSVDCPYMDENDNGEYVRYESLVDLLRN